MKISGSLETSEGSGKFQLLVENSGAPIGIERYASNYVDVTYEVDGADVTDNLTGDINQALCACCHASGAIYDTAEYRCGHPYRRL